MKSLTNFFPSPLVNPSSPISRMVPTVLKKISPSKRNQILQIISMKKDEPLQRNNSKLETLKTLANLNSKVLQPILQTYPALDKDDVFYYLSLICASNFPLFYKYLFFFCNIGKEIKAQLRKKDEAEKKNTC